MQPTPSASYSLTLRVKLSSRAGSLGELTMAIGRAGGDIGAIDIVSVGNDYIIRDITVSSVSSNTANRSSKQSKTSTASS
jgi:malate dehydrogenase (oxaloacetate-decarboxylating)